MADGGAADVDRLRAADGSLDREALLDLLPYGEDFLFVDRVTRLTPDEIEASFDVPRRAPYLDAHFVGLPLMPGALVGEGVAQAGTLLVRYRLDAHRDHHLLAFSIEKGEFLAPVRPGDTLTYRVTLARMNRRAARFAGEAWVGERKVSKARYVVGIVPRDQLADQLAGTSGGETA